MHMYLHKHYLLTPPMVFGFSFFLKEWGEMLVESFAEIKFDTHAFEHLELDQDHKTLVRALVDATREEKKDALISDVVQGGPLSRANHSILMFCHVPHRQRRRLDRCIAW